MVQNTNYKSEKQRFHSALVCRLVQCQIDIQKVLKTNTGAMETSLLRCLRVKSAVEHVYST